jgi:hypothetical protein
MPSPELRPSPPPKDTPATRLIRPSPKRAHTAPSRFITGQKSSRPDYVLVFCYMLVYLEVGWLIMMIWRAFAIGGSVLNF